MSTRTAESAASSGPTLAGHPAGLFVLFGAEMWERFSYYGMRALLVLYLTKHLHFERKDALNIYAIYTGLVYLTPMLGGYLADKYLGQRKAILIGGSLMALGHFAMAFEPLLYLALGLLILGNGFFKPNISTMVGQLYPQGDARRDGAYTIFYMGINLGAFFSPLVCGTLGERIGWHYGFGAAGVGMVLGLIMFTSLQHLLGTGGYPLGRAERGELRLTAADWLHVAVLTLVGVGVVYVAFSPSAAILRSVPKSRAMPVLMNWLAYAFVMIYWLALAFGMILITRLVAGRPEAATIGDARRPDAPDLPDEVGPEEKEDPSASFTWTQWQRIIVILIVGVFSIVFWMGFEQAGGTLTLFADQKTDRVLFGRAFPASWYQSFNPLLIFILAPLFSMLWTELDRTRYRLTATAKMGVGMILLGFGFVIMAQADRAASVTGKVGPLWLGGVYFLNTLGELCLSPIGLSLVNKLAPARVASLMMAFWFLSTAAANYLAGVLEELLKHTHFNLWNFLIVTSVVPGVILLALTPLLKKMGHGRI